MKNYRLSLGGRSVNINVGAGRFKIDVCTHTEFADGTNGITIEVRPSLGVKCAAEIERGGIHTEAVLIRIKNK